MSGAEGLGNGPGEEIALRVEGEEAHRGLQERAVHPLPEPRLLALNHRRAHAEGAQYARGEVEERDSRPHGLTSRLARDGHDAGKGLHERLVARRILARPRAAEGGDRAVDEARVDGGQRIVAETEALHGARAEVFDDHVRRRHEGFHHLHRLRLLEIELEAALVAIEKEIGGRFAILVGWPCARLVTAAGIFHLDHIRAEIGEERSTPRSSDDTREIDDADAVESERKGGHGRYYTSPRVTLQRQQIFPTPERRER